MGGVWRMQSQCYLILSVYPSATLPMACIVFGVQHRNTQRATAAVLPISCDAISKAKQLVIIYPGMVPRSLLAPHNEKRR